MKHARCNFQMYMPRSIKMYMPRSIKMYMPRSIKMYMPRSIKMYMPRSIKMYMPRSIKMYMPRFIKMYMPRSIKMYKWVGEVKPSLDCLKRNWVFATNSNFLILISLQPDGVFFHFKLSFSDPTNFIWLKCLRSLRLGCKDIDIRKSKFVAKTQFL